MSASDIVGTKFLPHRTETKTGGRRREKGGRRREKGGRRREKGGRRRETGEDFMTSKRVYKKKK